jgi:hypothetical protein
MNRHHGPGSSGDATCTSQGYARRANRAGCASVAR